MLKCNANIKDKHFQELHHAIGCPFPHDIHGISDDNRRNYFACDGEGTTADRMRSSDHWEGGHSKFGMTYFCVSDKGKNALLQHMQEYVSIPAIYEITYHDLEGSSVVAAKNRSSAKYKAYLKCDTDRPFIEYLSEIKSVKIHSKAHTATN